MKASIVITTYNRAPLLQKTLKTFRAQQYKDYEVIVVDDGTDTETPIICEQEYWPFPIKYFKRVREPGQHYSNPAVPNNIGLRQASGDIIILQNAECAHQGEAIQQFVDRVGAENRAVFAAVMALNENGSPQQYYTHSKINPRAFFFCGALPRKTFLDLRGFDENFKYYGMDDNQFADRMKGAGVDIVFDDSIHVLHQWHGSSYKPEDAERNSQNVDYYNDWLARFKRGDIGVQVNEGRDWGVL